VPGSLSKHILPVCPQSRADSPPWRWREKRKRRVTPRDAGQSRREEHEWDPVLGCRGMGILPMILTGPPPEAGDATWGMAFFAVKGTARARRGRGSHSIQPHPSPTQCLQLSCECSRMRLSRLRGTCVQRILLRDAMHQTRSFRRGVERPGPFRQRLALVSPR